MANLPLLPSAKRKLETQLQNETEQKVDLHKRLNSLRWLHRHTIDELARTQATLFILRRTRDNVQREITLLELHTKPITQVDGKQPKTAESILCDIRQQIASGKIDVDELLRSLES